MLNKARILSIKTYPQPKFPMIARAFLLASVLLLGGCDMINTLLADPRAIQREADSKAIGGACRYAIRSIEDCYSMNEKASKAAIFDGWREMDQYMRDNKIEGVESKGIKPESTTAVAADEEVVKGPAKADKKSAEADPKSDAKADAKAKPKAKPASADKQAAAAH